MLLRVPFPGINGSSLLFCLAFAFAPSLPHSPPYSPFFPFSLLDTSQVPHEPGTVLGSLMPGFLLSWSFQSMKENKWVKCDKNKCNSKHDNSWENNNNDKSNIKSCRRAELEKQERFSQDAALWTKTIKMRRMKHFFVAGEEGIEEERSTQDRAGREGGPQLRRAWQGRQGPTRVGLWDHIRDFGPVLRAMRNHWRVLVGGVHVLGGW